MRIPFPTDWLQSPPRYIVAGETIYAKVLGQILNEAALVIDDVLRKGIAAPPMVEGRSYRSAPLSDVDAIIVILAEAESASSLLWRHKRLWELPRKSSDRVGWHLDDVSWLFVAANEKQAQTFSELDVIGRSPAKATFRGWKPNGYHFLTMSDGLADILDSLQQLSPVSASDWFAELGHDKAASAIRDFRNNLERTTEPAIVAAQLSELASLVPSMTWERHFPPPQHRFANQMRNWLAVTRPDTPWLEEGRSLLAQIQS